MRVHSLSIAVQKLHTGDLARAGTHGSVGGGPTRVCNRHDPSHGLQRGAYKQTEDLVRKSPSSPYTIEQPGRQAWRLGRHWHWHTCTALHVTTHQQRRLQLQSSGVIRNPLRHFAIHVHDKEAGIRLAVNQLDLRHLGGRHRVIAASALRSARESGASQRKATT